MCLSEKTLERFFIILHHCFYSYKPQIHTKQTGLTIQFKIPQKNLCSCVKKKLKTNMMVVQMFFFFVSVCDTHRLVERLTVLLNNKDKNPGNEEA